MYGESRGGLGEPFCRGPKHHICAPEEDRALFQRLMPCKKEGGFVCCGVRGEGCRQQHTQCYGQKAGVWDRLG